MKSLTDAAMSNDRFRSAASPVARASPPPDTPRAFFSRLGAVTTPRRGVAPLLFSLIIALGWLGGFHAEGFVIVHHPLQQHEDAAASRAGNASSYYALAAAVSTTTPEPAPFPYFDFHVPRNVTTAVGQTAFLHCRVEQLGDKGVSWIRKRDLHILTAGILTYTSDARFQVIRPDRSDNWTLQIKFPQERDAGIYECQVNTEPKMSLAFRLNVIEAKARIMGPSDLYVKTGSTIVLSCEVAQGPHDLGTVFWYRGAMLVEAASPGRATADTQWSGTLTSRLKVTNARPADSGNYSCVPTLAHAQPASVTVHVINGEHPAAMQHGNKNSASVNLCVHILVYSFTVLLVKRVR
ncbi:zwei Ig domain protein zig-8 [Hetaerina americana]|uniref:zwei Ig domain protein zig-8 n=1 Tax=Hetaerina americana TaxID=62018 RepID=UPI003A7F2E45